MEQLVVLLMTQLFTLLLWLPGCSSYAKIQKMQTTESVPGFQVAKSLLLLTRGTISPDCDSPSVYCEWLQAKKSSKKGCNISSCKMGASYHHVCKGTIFFTLRALISKLVCVSSRWVWAFQRAKLPCSINPLPVHKPKINVLGLLQKAFSNSR